MIRQLPYNLKSKYSKEIGYFEGIFPLKQQQKHIGSFEQKF